MDVGAVTEELKRVPFFVPLFTPGHRHVAVSEALDLGFLTTRTIKHPSCVDGSDVDPAAGCYLAAGVTIGARSEFGRHVFINRAASVGHDCRLASYVSLAPGVTMGAHVEAGRGAFVGIGAVVLPEVRIGANAVVAAGSVVTTNVPERALVRGNPARVIRSGIAGHQGIAVE